MSSRSANRYFEVESRLTAWILIATADSGLPAGGMRGFDPVYAPVDLQAGDLIWKPWLHRGLGAATLLLDDRREWWDVLTQRPVKGFHATFEAHKAFPALRETAAFEIPCVTRPERDHVRRLTLPEASGLDRGDVDDFSVRTLTDRDLVLRLLRGTGLLARAERYFERSATAPLHPAADRRRAPLPEEMETRVAA